MKPVKAWAVTLPRKLHSITARTHPTIGDWRWMYPIYRSIHAARRAATEWIRNGVSADVVRVEIREVKARKGVARDND